ncbi:MAG: 30S ribosomal protein S20 [Rickettsiaceae bacterium]
MANTSSAKKAFKQTVKRRLINKSRHTQIKTYVKKLLLSLEDYNDSKKSEVISNFKLAQSKISKGVTKGIFKLNTASNMIAKLSNKVKSKTHKGPETTT